MKHSGKMKSGETQKIFSDFSTTFLDVDNDFGLVVQPGRPKVNLFDWVKENRSQVESALIAHGAILFRGFGIDQSTMRKAIDSIVNEEVFAYNKAAIGKRDKLGEGIYTSTTEPANITLQQHMEQSYIPYGFPMKAFFCSTVPAEIGGETPITNMRKFKRLLDPKIFSKFSKKHLLYIRNYDERKPWHSAFETHDKKEVANICKEIGMKHRWLDNNGLRTYNWGHATVQHPITGEELWMNHAHLMNFFSTNSDYVTPAFRAFRSLIPDESLPEMARLAKADPESLVGVVNFADGTSIPVETLWEIENNLNHSTLAFKWQKGDLIVLENMLCAHGRNPYVGSRTTLASFAQPFPKEKAVYTPDEMLKLIETVVPYKKAG